MATERPQSHVLFNNVSFAKPEIVRQWTNKVEKNIFFSYETIESLFGLSDAGVANKIAFLVSKGTGNISIRANNAGFRNSISTLPNNVDIFYLDRATYDGPIPNLKDDFMNGIIARIGKGEDRQIYLYLFVAFLSVGTGGGNPPNIGVKIPTN